MVIVPLVNGRIAIRPYDIPLVIADSSAVRAKELRKQVRERGQV